MAVNTQYPGYDEVFSSSGAGRTVYARSNQAKEVKKMLKMQRVSWLNRRLVVSAENPNI